MPRRRDTQVFVGFFGITRSLRFTAPGIQRNIISPIRGAGYAPRCFAHFHMPVAIDNLRSGERSAVVDPSESTLLDCEAIMTEPQDSALIAPEYAFCRTYPDWFQDGYASVRNLCFQLRSLRRLWGLMGGLVEADDWVLMLRPDLAYLDVLDIRAAIARIEAGGHDLGVPGWQGWGGLNDRFALCRGGPARAYAMRGTYVYEATALLGGLHGERLLAYVMHAERLRVGELAMRAVRIRANGGAAPQDLGAFCLSLG